jgi:hypothetical protein
MLVRVRALDGTKCGLRNLRSELSVGGAWRTSWSSVSVPRPTWSRRAEMGLMSELIRVGKRLRDWSRPSTNALISERFLDPANELKKRAASVTLLVSASITRFDRCVACSSCRWCREVSLARARTASMS